MPPAFTLLILLSAGLSAAELSIPAKGKAAFTITAPDGWVAVAGAEGATTLNVPQKTPHIQVWAIAGKRTVDEAVADLTAILTPQVKDFVIAKRSETTIAGGRAQLLVGTGSEADDGDPSNAQATVFAVGGRIWVLVSHGEGDGAAARAAEIAAALKLVTPVP